MTQTRTIKEINTYTKADYKLFLRCPEDFWISRKRPELWPHLDDQAMLNIEQGNFVDRYAQQLFEIPTFLESNNLTTASFTFQDYFSLDGLTIRTDILAHFPDGKIWLFEVKATTKLNDDKLNDLVFQKYVMEKCGKQVEKSFLIRVRKDYVSDGLNNVEELMEVDDATEEVDKRLISFESQLLEMKNLLSQNKMPEKEDFACDKQICIYWKEFVKTLPEKSVARIARFSKKNWKLMRDLGSYEVADLPEDLKLSDAQQLAAIIAQTDEIYIDQPKLKGWLDSLIYPLYFLDYEAISYLIPIQPGFMPYEHTAFQYSLHVVRSEGAKPEHYEFLLNERDEPVENLVKSLRENIGDTGSLIAWRMSFEARQHKILARIFPEYEDFLLGLNERMMDLEHTVNKQMYVDPKFKGKSSIKNVLPVMVPELSYSDLDISNGMAATWEWHKMTNGKMNQSEIEQTKYNLLEYCKLDTLAMVEIWKQLSRK